ncbi:hypothetical protein FQA39_LY04391 [Lamprigera yunnana]|nr:hypothetical protein FQA39_LY04391 [Lamprigera yunnana]
MKTVFITFVSSLLLFSIHGLRDVMDDLSVGTEVCFSKLNDSSAYIIDSNDQKSYLEEGNPIINEFYKCVFEESGYIIHNSINFDVLKNALLKNPGIIKEDVYKAFKKCKSIRSDDLGDRIVKMLNCLAVHKALH